MTLWYAYRVQLATREILKNGPQPNWQLRLMVNNLVRLPFNVDQLAPVWDSMRDVQRYKDHPQGFVFYKLREKGGKKDESDE